ncbi:heterokaryon incompatibility [Fusarium longipes]|uniref:Heterokaryon incompatibility n=1 Tax=Fusarium longipes TaxID=694270 RepID=A0A395SEI9_9HYPO|nr:heterokaryon incompatibility [Fusarium longipes]
MKEQEDELMWLLDWSSDDWVQLSLRTNSQYVGIEVYFQRNSMNEIEGGEAGTLTWNPRAAKALRDWLDECITLHDECQSLSNSSLPLRLIDTNPSGINPPSTDDTNNLSIDAAPHVRICSTAELPNETKYLTLSHCWGASVPIKLSENTFRIYEHGIPIQDLSKPEAKVFREAIWITRCLGYRYLWIDALCINQDDENEKSIEISRMDQIFNGATANLSATAASCGADGMIFTRNHNLFELFSCDWKLQEKKSQEGAEQESKDYLVAYVGRESIVKEPVNTRAWVFQERILAPRVIHFCRSRIHRECTQETLSDLHDYMPWISLEKGNGSSNINFPKFDRSRGFGETKKQARDWCYRFRSLVQAYSPTMLTFPRDRLAAFAGIAEAISGISGLSENQYFAGLWKPDLPRALLWQATNHYGERKWSSDYMGYISPSWSWAGCEAPRILYAWEPSSSWEDLVELLDISTVPEQLNGSPFGTLSHGEITLKGRLVEIHRKRIGDGFCISIRDNNSQLPEERYFEARRPRTTRELEERPEGVLKEIGIFWDNFSKASEREGLPAWQRDSAMDLDSWDKIKPEILYLIPVGQDSISEPFGAQNAINLMGLVLQCSGSTGSFTRVGLFDTYAPYPNETNEELRLRLLEGREVEVTVV